jgi:hypothetical protein
MYSIVGFSSSRPYTCVVGIGPASLSGPLVTILRYLKTATGGPGLLEGTTGLY